MKSKNFFTILDLGLKRKQWTCTDLSKRLDELGTPISSRSLQRYRTMEMVPSAIKAKQIFAALDVIVPDDDIEIYLTNARESKAKKLGPLTYIDKTIRLRASELTDNVEEEDGIIEEAEKRAYATSKERSFSKYVENLIKLDIENHILPDYPGNSPISVNELLNDKNLKK